MDDEIDALRRKIDEDPEKLSLCDLCVKTTGGFVVRFLNLEQKFYEMMSKVTAIKYSRFFNKLWQKYSEKLQGQTITMEIVFDTWQNICVKLRSIEQQFISGEMKLKKVDKYLDMFEKDYDALEKEFDLLLATFEAEKIRSSRKKALCTRMKKVENYKKLFDAREAARAILELQKEMELEGDFSEVEKIEEVSLEICIQIK